MNDFLTSQDHIGCTSEITAFYVDRSYSSIVMMKTNYLNTVLIIFMVLIMMGCSVYAKTETFLSSPEEHGWIKVSSDNLYYDYNLLFSTQLL